MSDGNCSLCGKADEVFRLISSDGCKICNECIGRCADQIAGEFQKITKDFADSSNHRRRGMKYAPILFAILLGWLALGAYLPKPCSVYPLECAK